MAYNKVTTSTQIRNLYADGMSSLGMKFFNMNLSFQFSPFLSRDQNNRNKFDTQNPLTTTVDWDGAFTLLNTANRIISGELKDELTAVITCANDCTLTLDRKMGMNGQMDTFFSITKNGKTIPFKFSTNMIQVKENGQFVPKIVECGLGTFTKTLEGYLTGINAERHLNKFTEDYIKSLEAKDAGATDNNENRPKYQNNYNSGTRRPYNNYNNNQGNNKPQWKNNNANNNNNYRQQEMSSYQLPE